MAVCTSDLYWKRMYVLIPTKKCNTRHRQHGHRHDAITIVVKVRLMDLCEERDVRSYSQKKVAQLPAQNEMSQGQ